MDTDTPQPSTSTPDHDVTPYIDPATGQVVLPPMPPVRDGHVTPETLTLAVTSNPLPWVHFIERCYITFNFLGTKYNEHLQYHETIMTEHHERGQRIATLEKTLRELRASNETLADLNKELKSSRHESKSEKLPDIEVYTGDRDKLEAWITDLKIKMNANKDRYPTEQSKLAYAVSRLGGKAKDQVNVYIKEDNIALDNIAEFIAVIETAFGDPDRKGTSQRTLISIRQRNRDFSTYFAEFNRHAQYTGWNDEALKAILHSGLSDELKNHLITVDTQELKLQAFAQKLQQLDNRARSTQATTRQFRPPFTGR